MTTAPNHWDLHAQRWRVMRPPLRPQKEDLTLYQELLEKHRADLPSPRVLLMGVTPELAKLPFGEGSSLVAVEISEAMVEHVWDEGSGHEVIIGDWRTLPFDNGSLKEGSFDIVLGDGCFTTLSGQEDYGKACANLAKALRPGGFLVQRFFVRAPIPESVDDVFAELKEGKIPTVEVFKWRLAMSLMDQDSKTVVLKNIWDTIVERCGEDLKLLHDARFRPRGIDTLIHYRDVDLSYSFPTITELREWLNPHFDLVEFRMPSYDLGERCPVTIWRKRA